MVVSCCVFIYFSQWWKHFALIKLPPPGLFRPFSTSHQPAERSCVYTCSQSSSHKINIPSPGEVSAWRFSGLHYQFSKLLAQATFSKGLEAWLPAGAEAPITFLLGGWLESGVSCGEPEQAPVCLQSFSLSLKCFLTFKSFGTPRFFIAASKTYSMHVSIHPCMHARAIHVHTPHKPTDAVDAEITFTLLLRLTSQFKDCRHPFSCSTTLGVTYSSTQSWPHALSSCLNSNSKTIARRSRNSPQKKFCCSQCGVAMPLPPDL